MKRGVTLIELLVTLAVIGLVASVATLAIGPARPLANDELTRARRHALETGRDTTIRFGDSASATAHPDGSMSADTVLHIERLNGTVHRE